MNIPVSMSLRLNGVPVQSDDQTLGIEIHLPAVEIA
jgi:hypothetical protein